MSAEKTAREANPPDTKPDLTRRALMSGATGSRRSQYPKVPRKYRAFSLVIGAWGHGR